MMPLTLAVVGEENIIKRIGAVRKSRLIWRIWAL